MSNVEVNVLVDEAQSLIGTKRQWDNNEVTCTRATIAGDTSRSGLKLAITQIWCEYSDAQGHSRTVWFAPFKWYELPTINTIVTPESFNNL